MKRLSLFDQLQIRFPIRARTNVRRSAEAGAAAARTSKSGLGGSLLTNMALCPRMQMVHLIVTASSPMTHISKDIVAEVGRPLFCNYYKKIMSLSCCYLAVVPLVSTTSCHTRASWHSLRTRVNFYAQLRC